MREGGRVGGLLGEERKAGRTCAGCPQGLLLHMQAAASELHAGAHAGRAALPCAVLGTWCIRVAVRTSMPVAFRSRGRVTVRKVSAEGSTASLVMPRSVMLSGCGGQLQGGDRWEDC